MNRWMVQLNSINKINRVLESSYLMRLPTLHYTKGIKTEKPASRTAYLAFGIHDRVSLSNY